MCVFVLGIALIVSLAACDSSDYKKAEELYNEGQYNEALYLFKNLGDYEDSQEKVLSCTYFIANSLFKDAQYEKAASFYEQLGDYKQSREQLSICEKEVGMRTNADYDFLEALEKSILSRMAHSNTTDYSTLVNTEFAYLSQFEGAKFYDKSLADFSQLYLQGLQEQKDALSEEYDDYQIGWQEGLVHRKEVLAGLYNEFGFMADNKEFVGTYVLEYEEERAKLEAYKAIRDDIQAQFDSDDFKVDWAFPRYQSGTLEFKLKNETAYTYNMNFIFSFLSGDGTLFFSSNKIVQNVKPGNSYVVNTNIDFTNCKSSDFEYTVNYSIEDVQLVKETKSLPDQDEKNKDAEETDILLDGMPDGMIINESKWDAWESTNNCMLFPFMDTGEQAGFEFTMPLGQGNSKQKNVDFVFANGKTLKNVEMYYGVEDQKILYTGLWTEDKNAFLSKDFREACIRLMLGYNIHYDDGAVMNLTRDRAEEIVDFCLKNQEAEHCLVDNMRIRVLREDEKPYYSFHLEY